MTMARGKRLKVRLRAEGRCEYCRVADSPFQVAPFQVEHIEPWISGGTSGLENLAWSCPRCNNFKAARRKAKDPATGKYVRLFHPRRDVWEDHFAWDTYAIGGKTAIGRATVAALDLNHASKLAARQLDEMLERRL